MSEQARFQEWWESTGTNSVILRAQAWSAWLARAEADQPQPDPYIALMEAEHDDRMQPQIDRALLLRMGEVEDSCRSISVGGMTKCNGCGKPLLPENAWMEDGCPCNSPRGVNSPQQQKTTGTDWSYHEKQKPQPQKRMLRLWIDSDCNIHAGLKGDRDLELHYDHETRQFYAEEQP